MTEKYRPKFHFTPSSGWMNDPNGMVLVDGSYHLFFQHDPGSTNDGPMHWGHAFSRDLIHWTELPVALFPSEFGTCFSGSAIITADGDVKLFHTAHRKTADGRDFQTQCLVHADRSCMSFVSDAHNPVLDNPGIEAFRDPKVVWHEETRRWVMVVTVGQAIGFYASDDLTHWNFESTFGHYDGRHADGVWECPDLLRMVGPDGQTWWVLIVGLHPGAYGPGSGTQYFVGQFDGHSFVNANPPEVELWMDYGRDFYACQSFFDQSGASPVVMAWASNWLYSRQTPTKEFRGAMTLPRELKLVNTADGMRLQQTVVHGLEAAFAEIDSKSTFHRRLRLTLREHQSATLTLFGEADPHFVITAIGEDLLRVETCRRKHAGLSEFEHAYSVEIPVDVSAEILLDVFVDCGLVELGIAGGTAWLTNVFYPEDISGPMTLVIEAEGTSLNVAALQQTWKGVEFQHG